jgi:hypothetical protein
VFKNCASAKANPGQNHAKEVVMKQDRDTLNSAASDPIAVVREALTKLKFGAISLTVHEGKLVQIEVTEKRRFV